MCARPLLMLLVLGAAACSSEKRLREACDRGEPGACDVLSARYAYGEGVRQDPVLASELAQRTMQLCAKDVSGMSPTCARLGYGAIAKGLPEGAASDAGTVATVLVVVVTADGALSIDGKSVATDDAFLDAARAARHANPELRAVIKADSGAAHGRVIHVLDLLKQADIQKIAFGVSPVPSR